MLTGSSKEEQKPSNEPDPEQAQQIKAERSSDSTEEKGTPPVPISHVAPVVPGEGIGPQIVALAKYMMRTEVHTYAFSVAANVILSLFPFIVMMLTISRVVFHSTA